MHGHIGTVTDIVYLGNDLVASCSVDFSIRLWDSSTFTAKGNCLAMRSLWVNTLCSVSGLLWSGSDDAYIRVWDTNSGATLKEIVHTQSGGSSQIVRNKSVEKIEESENLNNFTVSDCTDSNLSKHRESYGVTQLSYCPHTGRVWSLPEIVVLKFGIHPHSHVNTQLPSLPM